MADSWSEYLWGGSQQRAADLEYQERQRRAAMDTDDYRRLRRAAYSGPDVGVDPRMMMYGLPTEDGGTLGDTLHPRRTSDAAEDLSDAYEYVAEMGVRGRDTGVIGTQALLAGEPLRAAGYYARSVPAMFYPPAAAGTPGSPDDWREHARRQGVSEANILAFDLLTDPENYIAAPLKGPLSLVPVGMAMRSASALRGLTGADAAMDAMRYGRGIRTELVDRHGEAIRRLQSAKPAPRMGLPGPGY